MYSMTTFEWVGGMKNLLVPAFKVEHGEPFLVIKSLEIEVENNCRGYMYVEFGARIAEVADCKDSSLTREMEKFIGMIRDSLGFGGYSWCGDRYIFSYNPKSGEPLTEGMMKKYLLLATLCGFYAVAPPRIVTETFTGRYPGDMDERVIPYGAYLMAKCQKEMLEDKKE